MFSYLNPYVHSAHKLRLLDSIGEKNESEQCRILYSRSASFTVALAEEKLKFFRNSFLFIPENVSYTIISVSEEGEAIEICFDLSDKRPIPEESGEEKFVFARREVWFADAMHLMDELNNFFATWQSEEPFSREFCSARLKIILLKMLANDIGLARGVTTMRIRRALRYIEAHYSEPITNEEIAASVGLHPYYLSRLVKEECGVSLHRYLLNYRLAVGARMLEGGEDNVENISAQCGFTYCSHFINAFRALFGMSPKQYAKTHSMKKSYVTK